MQRQNVRHVLVVVGTVGTAVGTARFHVGTVGTAVEAAMFNVGTVGTDLLELEFITPLSRSLRSLH